MSTRKENFNIDTMNNSMFASNAMLTCIVRIKSRFYIFPDTGDIVTMLDYK